MCQSCILIGKGSRVTSLGHSYNSACNRQRKRRRWWQSSSLPPSPSHVLWLSGPRGKWSPERADGAEAAVADHCAALDLFISLVDSRRICSAEWPSFLCISAMNSPRKTRIGTGKKVKRVERKGLARAEPSRLSRSGDGASRQFRSWEEPLVRKGRSEQQRAAGATVIQSFSCAATAIACDHALCHCHLLLS